MRIQAVHGDKNPSIVVEAKRWRPHDIPSLPTGTTNPGSYDCPRQGDNTDMDRSMPTTRKARPRGSNEKRHPATHADSGRRHPSQPPQGALQRLSMPRLFSPSANLRRSLAGNMNKEANSQFDRPDRRVRNACLPLPASLLSRAPLFEHLKRRFTLPGGRRPSQLPRYRRLRNHSRPRRTVASANPGARAAASGASP